MHSCLHVMIWALWVCCWLPFLQLTVFKYNCFCFSVSPEPEQNILFSIKKTPLWVVNWVSIKPKTLNPIHTPLVRMLRKGSSRPSGLVLTRRGGALLSQLACWWLPAVLWSWWSLSSATPHTLSQDITIASSVLAPSNPLILALHSVCVCSGLCLLTARGCSSFRLCVVSRMQTAHLST